MDKNKNDAIKKYKNDTMKLLRWIAPPFLAVIAYVLYMLCVALSYYLAVNYRDFNAGIVLSLLPLPILPFLYSAKLLKDCKHRICYTLYCSYFFGFDLYTLSLLMGKNPGIEWLGISVGLFAWCELGALLGLLRYKKVK